MKEIRIFANREIRKVPKDWQHPRRDGAFIPLLNQKDVEEGYDPKKVMPRWDSREATHYMLYETTSEGTPLSPAFETRNLLLRWIIENKISLFGENISDLKEWMEILS